MSAFSIFRCLRFGCSFSCWQDSGVFRWGIPWQNWVAELHIPWQEDETGPHRENIPAKRAIGGLFILGTTGGVNPE